MNVEVRGDTVFITGYVNAVERYSKPITDTLRNKIQTFIERIRAGVFKTALKRNNDVKVLLNHDVNRELASTKDNSAKLEEDNIGLRAEVIITDKEVVAKARENKLVGWSFGFFPNADEIGAEDGNITRTVTDLDLVEVSILDDTKSPAYYGTSIESRCEGGKTMEIRTENSNAENEKKENSVDVEQLATAIAEKVAELLKSDVEEKEEKPNDSAETTSKVDDETVETDEETDETEEDDAEDEDSSARSIDYSDFENRIEALK